MKKMLLATSLICGGLAFGSLSENAKADDSQPANTNNQDQAQVNSGSSLVNNQSVTLRQPSEIDTNTILSNFTNDSGISTTQDGISYIVTQQDNGYQIELSQNMGQYNHLLAIYSYNPAAHTFTQTGGDFQTDTPTVQPVNQEYSEQESSKPMNSQQLGSTNEATGQDSDDRVHNANSGGLEPDYTAQSKTLPQTGNANSKAGLGGLVLVSLASMFALGKRKEKY